MSSGRINIARLREMAQCAEARGWHLQLHPRGLLTLLDEVERLRDDLGSSEESWRYARDKCREYAGRMTVAEKLMTELEEANERIAKLERENAELRRIKEMNEQTIGELQDALTVSEQQAEDNFHLAQDYSLGRGLK